MADITRAGVTISEEEQEAAAIAPITRAMLFAYELWHDGMTQPVRFVDDTQDLMATLEADAPRNAGEEVEFIACRVSAARPSESDSAGTPTIELARSDVSGPMLAALAQSRGDPDIVWTLIERRYASDNTSTPSRLPVLELEVTVVDIAGKDVRISAQYDDDANEPIPRLRFVRAEHPGLAR